MRKDFIDNGHTRLAIRPTGSLSGRSAQPQAFSSPCAQVAAVCYRNTSRGLELLLVKTRGGRWTFPKGGVEPGLTYAQVAALEAFEEAGVHGRMEEEAFVLYIGSQSTGKGKQSGSPTLTSAHLCEVLSLTTPQESKRSPTWFSAEKAKRRLLTDRPHKEGMALAGVVGRAVLRIQKGQRETHLPADGLRRVQFEASETFGFRGQMEEAFLARYVRRAQRQGVARTDTQASASGGIDVDSNSPSHNPRGRVLQLGDGSVAVSQKVTSIDRVSRRMERLSVKSARARS